MTTKQELLQVWEELGPNAQHIFFRIGQRMADGAKKYGDFPVRTWTKEAAEEALDLCVYLTAELEMPALLAKNETPPAGNSLTPSYIGDVSDDV